MSGLAGGSMALTPKKARFVEEYLVDLNATQAAIRAGYSTKTAYSQGQRLLKDVEVAAAIQAAQAKRSEKTGITAARVIEELAKIGFSDIRKAVKWGSRLIERPEETVPGGESLEAQPHGGALKRRKVGDDGTDAFYVTTVELQDSEALDDDTAAAISEVSQTKEGVKIKLHDKKGALVDLGRHLGLFTDRVEHSGAVAHTITQIELVGPDDQSPD